MEEGIERTTTNELNTKQTPDYNNNEQHSNNKSLKKKERSVD